MAVPGGLCLLTEVTGWCFSALQVTTAIGIIIINISTSVPGGCNIQNVWSVQTTVLNCKLQSKLCFCAQSNHKFTEQLRLEASLENSPQGEQLLGRMRFPPGAADPGHSTVPRVQPIHCLTSKLFPAAVLFLQQDPRLSF